MASKLVIVESPAKAKTLNRYLGNDYAIKASMGHIRDLPSKELSVDVEKNFKPHYVIIPQKKKTVDDLKKAANGVSEIYIATDPDREGEAIAWHIAHILKTADAKIHRVMFNEITKDAVVKAIQNPGDIDNNRVDAQQARRVLDRLVGYLVSEQLWRVIAKGLSAGRVQSVALRIIVERELEIEAFTPEEYWNISALAKVAQTTPFKVRLARIAGQDAHIDNGEMAAGVLEDLKQLAASVADIRDRENRQKPKPPFITSTLQQEASHRLNFPVKRTMSVAQQLYEGIELGDAGAVGLITYMRTDSTRMADSAVAAARTFIQEKYGKKFLSPRARQFGKKGRVQDAHEAIRPTSLEWEPVKVKKFLKPEQFRLYELIWNRFLATQMAEAIYESVTVDIGVGELGAKPFGEIPADGKSHPYILRASGKRLLFPGFRQLWGEIAAEDSTDEENDVDLPDIFFTLGGKNGKENGKEAETGMAADISDVDGEQKFTQPPPRYSESSLVKTLDELSIGRPSTYAQIISTLLDRKYVEREKKKLKPTELGRTVNKILVSEFDEVFNVKYTATMEEALDKVEEGQNWTDTVKKFWDPFKEHIERFKNNRAEIKKKTQEKVGRKCPECGNGELIERWGRYGKFISCDQFPKCKYIEKVDGENGKEKPEPQSTGKPCPECKTGELVERQGRYGSFVACNRYPKCKYIEKQKDGAGNRPEPKSTGRECPQCKKGELVERTGRYGTFVACNRYPKCKYIEKSAGKKPGKPKEEPKPVGRKCPDCENGDLLLRKGRFGDFIACSNYPKCKYSEKVETKKSE